MHRGPAARVGRLELSCELCSLSTDGSTVGSLGVGALLKTARVQYRIIDLAIRKNYGCNSGLAALQVKRKSEVAAMRLLSGQKTEDRTVSAQSSVHTSPSPRPRMPPDPKLTVQGTSFSGMGRVFFG
jgi:hypothetical protein